MNIPPELKINQGRLSRLNVDFLDYVVQNPSMSTRSYFQGIELNDPLFTLQPWPTFISKKTVAHFKEVGEKIFELIKFFPERLFNGDISKISEFFELPKSVIQIQLDGMQHEYYENLVGRGDFILSSDGLKCIEFNVSANLGGLQLPIWESMCIQTAGISQFIKEKNLTIYNKNLIYHFLAHVLWKPLETVQPGDEINIAFMGESILPNQETEKNQIYLNQIYQQVLLSKGKSLKGNVFLGNFPLLKIVNNEVYYKGKRIHVLLEFNHGFVPHQVINAFKERKVTLINGPITGLMSSKLVLALLSDHQKWDTFTPEERKFIDTYIPWTRKIKTGSVDFHGQHMPDMEKFLLENRHQLVIKPGTGYGGADVVVGPKSTPGQWQAAVANALSKKNWLVQEMVYNSTGLYLAGESECVPHDMVWGFFIFGNTYVSAWVRVMPQENNKGVINCHQGATGSIVIEVDE